MACAPLGSASAFTQRGTRHEREPLGARRGASTQQMAIQSFVLLPASASFLSLCCYIHIGVTGDRSFRRWVWFKKTCSILKTNSTL